MEKLAQPVSSVVAKATARAFDGVGAKYDRMFDSQPLTQRLRRRIYKIVEDRIDPGSSILDLSCGTGTDALYFAAKGHQVVGIDISKRMIAMAEEKRRSQGLRGVHFQVASFGQLPRSLAGRYDLAISNFGGLNCTPDLRSTCTEVARLVKPKGYFVAVVMPPFSLWEAASAIVRGNIGLARRRWSRSARAAGFGEESFDVWYHSAGSLARAFRQAFRVEEVLGLDIVSPPPHARQFVSRHPRLTASLQRADSYLGSLPLLRSLGDHVLVVFRREPR